MPVVLLSGGTGLVGSALTLLLLDKGYTVIVLTRNPPKQASSNPKLRYARWSVTEQTIDLDAVKEATHVVHLAGAGVVDKRWTPAYKTEILRSRTESAALLINAVRQHNPNIKAWVNASAIGWYGPDPEPMPTDWPGFIETDPPHNDYLGNTCVAWENSVAPVAELGIRLVKLRIGIVLSADGGALREFVKPLRFGIAGILGHGRQIISWIGIHDLCQLFLYALENPAMQGSYNAVAPQPVSNRELTLTLARQVRGRWFIPAPVPGFVLQLMLGESSIEVLKSTRVSSAKIIDAGFTFETPDIDSCLKKTGAK